MFMFIWVIDSTVKPQRVECGEYGAFSTISKFVFVHAALACETWGSPCCSTFPLLLGSTLQLVVCKSECRQSVQRSARNSKHRSRGQRWQPPPLRRSNLMYAPTSPNFNAFPLSCSIAFTASASLLRMIRDEALRVCQARLYPSVLPSTFWI